MFTNTEKYLKEERGKKEEKERKIEFKKIKKKKTRKGRDEQQLTGNVLSDLPRGHEFEKTLDGNERVVFNQVRQLLWC
jgi:hypothetical protein